MNSTTYRSTLLKTIRKRSIRKPPQNWVMFQWPRSLYDKSHLLCTMHKHCRGGLHHYIFQTRGIPKRNICPHAISSCSWWRYQMETFFALLALCAGNSTVTGEFPAQRPVTRSFDVFFDLCLNKRLSKRSWGWWFETPSRSLWRQLNARGDLANGVVHTRKQVWCIYIQPDSKWVLNKRVKIYCVKYNLRSVSSEICSKVSRFM